MAWSNPTFWRSFSEKWFNQHMSCSWHVFTKNEFRIVTNFLDKKETLLARRICNYIKNLWNGMFKSCLYKRRFSLTCGSLGLFWFYFGQCTNNGQCSAVNNCVHIVVHTQPKQVDWPSIAIEFHPPTFWQVFQKSKLPYNIWVAAHHMLFSRFFKPLWTSLVSLFVIVF